jgi:hypothetical protein
MLFASMLASPVAVAVCIGVLLAACDGKGAPDASSEAESDHVWRSQTDQLDKAKAVEGQLMEATRSRMKEGDVD